MDELSRSEWTKEIYKDFPEHKSAIDSLLVSTEHFNELARDYYKCKSIIEKLSKDQTLKKLDEYEMTLDDLKSELIELLKIQKL